MKMKVGPGALAKCFICLWGFHEVVDREAMKGATWQDIKVAIKREFPELYRESKVKRSQIKNHVYSSHCSVKVEQVNLMRGAARAIRTEKASAAQIGEQVLDYLSKALHIADTITTEDIDELETKDKFAILSKANNDIMKAQEVYLKAKQVDLQNQAWLKELGVLASKQPGVNEIQDGTNN